jgi:hypothetical protein
VELLYERIDGLAYDRGAGLAPMSIDVGAWRDRHACSRRSSRPAAHRAERTTWWPNDQAAGARVVAGGADGHVSTGATRLPQWWFSGAARLPAVDAELHVMPGATYLRR